MLLSAAASIADASMRIPAEPKVPGITGTTAATTIDRGAAPDERLTVIDEPTSAPIRSASRSEIAIVLTPLAGRRRRTAPA